MHRPAITYLILLGTFIVLAIFTLHPALQGNLGVVVSAQASTPTESAVEGRSGHECDDDPSGPDCPPSGNLSASKNTIDIGEEVTLTASNLMNVGTHVAFELDGPIDFDRDCGAGASRASDGTVGARGGTAEVSVFGCAPGGEATATLTTTGTGTGRITLASITITVNPPPPSGDLSASKNTIDVGEEATLTASNLLNVGPYVAFELDGPIHFDRDCGAGASRAVRASGGTAERTVYGCAPGGEATVTLATTGAIRIELASVTITVNPPPPSGDLSASKDMIDVGEAVTLEATNLLNVGTHVALELRGPIHFNPSCDDGAYDVSDDTAERTVYGCAPGGIATATLATAGAGRIELASVVITVNPPPPSGDLSASKEIIDVGELTILTVSNLETYGAGAYLDPVGPINVDSSCTSSVSGSSGTSGPTVTEKSYLYYGCLPGGTAMVKLKSGNEVLDSVTITVNEPPTYAPMIPSPGHAIACSGINIYHREKINSHSETVRSPGGYTHTATVEIWEALMLTLVGPPEYPIVIDYSQRCIEARIINESSPGAAQSSWSGMLYDTRPRLIDPDIDLEALMQGDFSNFIILFNDPDPKSDGTLVRTVTHNCATCSGGTIQTQKHILPGGALVHYTVHLFSQHTFSVGDWRRTIDLEISNTVTPHATDDFFEAIVAELVDLLFGYAKDLLERFARWIDMFI